MLTTFDYLKYSLNNLEIAYYVAQSDVVASSKLINYFIFEFLKYNMK